ncbi:MAG: class I SAM-dependent rRNA methyltransferase [Chrysiogenales bacterium]|nr:MAG: class I SAM-dependent rRNA methyltransferase [Chrysiogenales bacterium]
MMHIETLFKKAFERRRALYEDRATNCFRLFNGEGDGLPGLTLDWYGEYLLLQYFEPGLNELTREIVGLIESSPAMFPLTPGGVLLKNRLKSVDVFDMASATRSVLLAGGAPPECYHVRQNGVAAVVDLVGGQSTGIFLDMRGVRDRLAAYYTPADVMLNLFCYTALFSVHALKNGISSAVNVDLSRGLLDRARVNYAINGLRIDDRDFIYGDSIGWTRRFHKKGVSFSFALFDPPTFSRNRRRTFSVKRHYPEALALLSRIADRGWVLTSVNSPGIGVEEYIQFHPEGWKLEFLEHESSDFTRSGPPYLKAGLWRVL